MKLLELRKSVTLALLGLMVAAPAAQAAEETAPVAPPAAQSRTITFPVKGPVRFTNDFGAPRAGHTHQGNDIFGTKMQPLVAAADGTVVYLVAPFRPEPSDPSAPSPSPSPSATASPAPSSAGYAIFIRDAEGFTYRYVHVNNDSPGTDDGAATFEQAFTADMRLGQKVTKGQLIGYLGDSGNAESTAAHLHFEIRMPDGGAMNPFDSLSAAPHEKQAAPAKAAKASCKKKGKKTICPKAKPPAKKKARKPAATKPVVRRAR